MHLDVSSNLLNLKKLNLSWPYSSFFNKKAAIYVGERRHFTWENRAHDDLNSWSKVLETFTKIRWRIEGPP